MTTEEFYSYIKEYNTLVNNLKLIISNALFRGNYTEDEYTINRIFDIRTTIYDVPHSLEGYAGIRFSLSSPYLDDNKEYIDITIKIKEYADDVFELITKEINNSGLVEDSRVLKFTLEMNNPVINGNTTLQLKKRW